MALFLGIGILVFGGFLKYVTIFFHPEPWGKRIPILTFVYFSDALSAPLLAEWRANREALEGRNITCTSFLYCKRNSQSRAQGYGYIGVQRTCCSPTAPGFLPQTPWQPGLPATKPRKMPWQHKKEPLFEPRRNTTAGPPRIQPSSSAPSSGCTGGSVPRGRQGPVDVEVIKISVPETLMRSSPSKKHTIAFHCFLLLT